jgi:hypothetical protein
VSKEQQADGPAQGGSVDEGGGGHPHGVRSAQPERKIATVGVGSCIRIIQELTMTPETGHARTALFRRYKAHVSIQ